MIGPAVLAAARGALGALRAHAPEEAAALLAEEVARLREARPDLARDLVAGAAADLAANAAISWREAMTESVGKRGARA